MQSCTLPALPNFGVFSVLALTPPQETTSEHFSISSHVANFFVLKEPHSGNLHTQLRQ